MALQEFGNDQVLRRGFDFFVLGVRGHDAIPADHLVFWKDGLVQIDLQRRSLRDFDGDIVGIEHLNERSLVSVGVATATVTVTVVASRFGRCCGGLIVGKSKQQTHNGSGFVQRRSAAGNSRVLVGHVNNSKRVNGDAGFPHNSGAVGRGIYLHREIVSPVRCGLILWLLLLSYPAVLLLLLILRIFLDATLYKYRDVIQNDKARAEVTSLVRN
mmetsp:Transcript_27964/g.61609  ORF Transcript_27964/g.61609 Transcript_27964/m.61609 type:complete len:214 (+) Transcript_27964:1113-1754(+)